MRLIHLHLLLQPQYLLLFQLQPLLPFTQTLICHWTAWTQMNILYANREEPLTQTLTGHSATRTFSYPNSHWATRTFLYPNSHWATLSPSNILHTNREEPLARTLICHCAAQTLSTVLYSKLGTIDPTLNLLLSRTDTLESLIKPIKNFLKQFRFANQSWIKK